MGDRFLKATAAKLHVDHDVRVRIIASLQKIIDLRMYISMMNVVPYINVKFNLFNLFERLLYVH